VRVVSEREAGRDALGLPVTDHTMVQNYTPNDLDHLAENAMSPDDRVLDARTFVDLSRFSDDRIRGDFRRLMDKQPFLGIRRWRVCHPFQELQEAHD
jgi:hypothetical protein